MVAADPNYSEPMIAWGDTEEVDVDKGRPGRVLELSRFRDNSRERVLEGHTCPPPLWAFGLGATRPWGLPLGALQLATQKKEKDG